jgi:predicted nuclease of predicted toxin-antitoxin system
VKLLLDACMWHGAVEELRRAGHDVSWVVDWGPDPGDPAILARAHREERVLVTLDKDFGELAVSERMPHAGIIRIVEESVWHHAVMVQRVIDENADALRAAAIIVVEPDRTRVRIEEPDA